MDACGVHSFVCERAPGKTTRHHTLNDLIARAFSSSGLPVTKEPSGLLKSEGKRPDGLTLVPWSSSKALCWDVTITCPLADSYIFAAARQSGAAAELAASRKERSTLLLMAGTSLSRSPSRLWAFLTHQLARSCLISVEKFREYRESQRSELSVPKMLGARATFQCHTASR